MTTETKTKRKPTHTIFHVRGEGQRAYWAKIGSAWLHDDQEGLSLAIDLMPVAGTGRIVVRMNKADDAKTQGEAA